MTVLTHDMLCSRFGCHVLHTCCTVTVQPTQNADELLLPSEKTKLLGLVTEQLTRHRDWPAMWQHSKQQQKRWGAHGA